MFRGVALALVLLEGAARADDPLAQASEAIAASDYVAARAALVTAQVAGDHSPDDTAEMYRLSGVVEAALGNAQAATEAFTRLLALVPKAKLPAGTSPKITRPFDAARSYYTTHAPLDLKIATAAKPPAITLVVVSDPVHLVARARVVYAIDRGPERIEEVAVEGRTDIALPAGKRIDARVIALDAHGNRLVEIGSKEVPIVIIGEPPPVVAAPRPAPRPPPRPAPPTVELTARPIYLRWWPYAAATVVCAGATAYFGWSAYSDARELQRLSIDHSVLSPEFQSVRDHGQRATLITNIGFGVTGAFALAAGAMFLIRRAHTEVRVTAVPAQAGGALVLGGTF